MVWKMLVEEFQDGCLELGHLCCVNWMILPILGPHFAGSLPSSSSLENIWFGKSWLKNSKMDV